MRMCDPPPPPPPRDTPFKPNTGSVADLLIFSPHSPKVDGKLKTRKKFPKISCHKELFKEYFTFLSCC